MNHLQEQVECLLCCFMLEDLRRFQAWHSGATRPYTGGQGVELLNRWLQLCGLRARERQVGQVCGTALW